MSESGGAAAGYKIAYTNAIMRERAGIDAPCSGLILSGGVQQSPVTLDSGRYFRLGIECEVAVRLGADLPASGAPYTRESVSGRYRVARGLFRGHRRQGRREPGGRGSGAQGNRNEHKQRRGRTRTARDWLASDGSLRIPRPGDRQRRDCGRGAGQRGDGASGGAAGVARQQPGLAWGKPVGGAR